MSKLTDIASAVDDCVTDGTTLYLGGFTHLIPFAAGHEVIRQEYSALTIVRTTPDLIVDRMIAAGCVDRVLFSYAGNPGVGSLRCFRRAVETDVPRSLSIEEYSHLGLVSRLDAGAKGLPFLPVKAYLGTDIPEVTESIRSVVNPFADGLSDVPVVPPLHPDVAIVRAQRADAQGNAHVWGITGEIVEATFAAERVILSVEEVVDESIIRSDPNRTAIPAPEVDWVVEEPYGSHPSYAQGYYDRDNDAYLAWDAISSTHADTLAWLDEFVFGVDNHDDYLDTIGRHRLELLAVEPAMTAPANLGRY